MKGTRRVGAPAKSISATRSPPSVSLASIVNCLARSKRFGVASLASMLRLTSITKATSSPRCCICSTCIPQRGSINAKVSVTMPIAPRNKRNQPRARFKFGMSCCSNDHCAMRSNNVRRFRKLTIATITIKATSHSQVMAQGWAKMKDPLFMNSTSWKRP